MKEPLLAALLNFSFSGTGYLYLGRRRLFAWLLITSFIASALSATLNLFLLFSREALASESPFVRDLLIITPGLLACLALLTLAMGLAVDAYNEAKRINKRY